MNSPAATVRTANSASSTRVATYAVSRGAGIDAIALTHRQPVVLRGTDVRVRVGAVALNHRDLMLADGRSGAGGPPIVPGSAGSPATPRPASILRSCSPATSAWSG